MSMLEKFLGPKSKYDKALPYTYEARIRIFDDGEEFHSYFADTICGLVEYLHQNEIAPEGVTIVEIYQESEKAISTALYTTPDHHHWLFKPALCRSFAQHYNGHIQEQGCSFKDRSCAGSGPW